MNPCPPDAPTLDRFIEEIARLPPRPHHSSLLDRAAELMPGCDFRFALSRGGWYRAGGLLDATGERVTDDLDTWIANALEECDGDIDAFLDQYGAAGLQVTRRDGRTHYFVAAYGPEPADFLQLEVEELQEVLDRLLVNPDTPPEDSAELSDPLAPARLSPQPVGLPVYNFRRLVDMRRVAARAGGPRDLVPAIARFLTEWRGGVTADHFSDHWIVGLRENPDRYGNLQTSATPISLHARKLKHFPWNADTRGVELGNQLHAFDRAAGYPTAWYFHMIAGAIVPRELAYVLMDDWQDGFRYLSDRDAALLKGWLEQPYSV
jgi:hypothetical protein